METVGLGFCFEDLPVGRQFKTIGRTVTEADITNFVNCTGMVEVLFTNTEFLAHESDIKGRPAPGALVYCFAEGLLVQSTMQHTGFALHMELSVESPVVAGAGHLFAGHGVSPFAFPVIGDRVAGEGAQFLAQAIADLALAAAAEQL